MAKSHAFRAEPCVNACETPTPLTVNLHLNVYKMAIPSIRHLAYPFVRWLTKEASERKIYASVLRPETVSDWDTVWNDDMCRLQVTSVLSKAQARDIVVMDMRQKCNYTDYFILATGHSHQHLERLGSAVLFRVGRRRDREAQ